MKKIEICGSGCDKYFETLHNFQTIVNKERIKADIIEITDRNIIATKCISNMPAVFINGKLISQGKALSE